MKPLLFVNYYASTFEFMTISCRLAPVLKERKKKHVLTAFTQVIMTAKLELIV